MKAGQLNRINPAADTRWYIESEKRIYRLRIGGVYFKGFADRFRITAYEIHYEHTTEVQIIDAEAFKKHIAEGKVKPDYNEQGLLIY